MTVTSSARPRSDEVSAYTLSVAPPTGAHSVPFGWQRDHWNVYAARAPELHLPGPASSHSPTRAVPLRSGRVEFVGAASESEVAGMLAPWLASEVSSVLPLPFVPIDHRPHTKGPLPPSIVYRRRVPSGVQAGESTYSLERLVTGCRLEPSAFMTYSWLETFDPAANAIFYAISAPFGDHAGPLSFPAEVICVRLVLFGFSVTMPPLVSNASSVPSGDHAGW